jgi:hypothetical protein
MQQQDIALGIIEGVVVAAPRGEVKREKVARPSRHLDGGPSDEECGAPLLSADGRRAAWDTAWANRVDGDTDGIGDVFLRGPLRWTFPELPGLPRARSPWRCPRTRSRSCPRE